MLLFHWLQKININKPAMTLLLLTFIEALKYPENNTLFEILFNSHWLSKFLKPNSRTVILILVIFAVRFGIIFSLDLRVRNYEDEDRSRKVVHTGFNLLRTSSSV